MIDLTSKIPMRGFLQEGSEYNRVASRSNDTLVVERYNKGADAPWMTRYTKKCFLGLITYWKFDGWWGVDGPTTNRITKSLFR